MSEERAIRGQQRSLTETAKQNRQKGDDFDKVTDYFLRDASEGAHERIYGAREYDAKHRG